MTPERTLELLRLLTQHRIWDEIAERWVVEYDPLVAELLGLGTGTDLPIPDFLKPTAVDA